jgi:hypothetical protein
MRANLLHVRRDADGYCATIAAAAIPACDG